MIILPQQPETSNDLWRPPAEPTHGRPAWVVGGAVLAACVALLLGALLTYDFIRPFMTLINRM